MSREIPEALSKGIFVAAQSADEALQRFVATGRVSHYAGGRAAEIVSALARCQLSRRKCLSCGAEQSTDGTLPCGH